MLNVTAKHIKLGRGDRGTVDHGAQWNIPTCCSAIRVLFGPFRFLVTFL